ncbi:peptidoglycan-binding protein [Clostridium brassicae]|uniref:Peptidoglycan-binding protein n=1 Tax=Clostridium brassicae TaxID=2999072 RepID=A0ABT4DCZ2_9CLOT|nr:peptidoglycan-binding protein [Clostridium brassicae]MCY6960167.1 peptidoglycan-binding protein [Clostridium brassicae]
MKSKKIMAITLAAGIFIGGVGVSPIKAFAATENKVQAKVSTQKELQSKVYKLLNKIKVNPNEKDIKEARRVIEDIDNHSYRATCSYLLNLYINNNIDKNVSSIDELVNAYKMNKKITSCEVEQNLGIKLDGKNLSKEEEKNLAQILSIINSLNVKTDIKTVSRDENKKAVAEGNVKVSVNGVTMDMKVWSDVDTTGSNPKIKSIIEIPEALKVIMPAEYKDKKYFVYDISKILSNSQTVEATKMIDFQKLINSANNFGVSFNESFANFIKIADAKYDIVSKGDASKLGNNSVKAYKIDLNNEKLINVIKYALKDKKMTGLVKDYINDIMALDPNYSGTKVTDEQLSAALNQTIMILDKMKDAVQIDISIDVGVDKSGYVSYNKGNVKFTVNVGEISKMSGDIKAKKDVVNTNSIYTLLFNFDSNISKINEDIKTNPMPEVNEKNSIDYMEFVMNMAKQNSNK